MRLAHSRDEALRICEALHELIHIPLQDTLNIKNGLNYAMFLEAIIRIGYHKLEIEGGDGESGYKNILEQMFNDGNIEIKKRMMEDRMLSEIYSHDMGKVFLQHSSLFSAIFSAKATVQLENFLEMSKEDFMGLLVESGLLNEKKEEEQTGEIKRKFSGENIMATIHNVGTFDSNYLTYVDFLDCLVRVASMYPFSEADSKHFQAMDARMQFVANVLTEKYGSVVPAYIEVVGKRENEVRYQPRMVVDDDAEDEYDDM